MWPFLEDYNYENCKIHFIRAGKNKAWTGDIMDRMHSLCEKKKGKIFLHNMEHVGHWVHAEDLRGFIALVNKESSCTRIR